jgi:hypothetical protein
MPSRGQNLRTYGRPGMTKPATMAVLAALLTSVGWSQANSSGQQSKIVNDFGTRISQYLALRQKETGAPAKQSDSSQKLVEQQNQAAAKIQAARSAAKQGDVFTPEITEYFKNQIASSISGKHGKKIRSSLRHSEPVSGMTLRVNETYPQGVPLQSMPASLLQRLPVLPQELEYRILGRDLVLHDIGPNIIVDFISNAMPIE